MRYVEVRQILPDGTLGEYLPDVAALEWGDDKSDIGGVTLSYPTTGLNYDLIQHKAEFAILVDSSEIWNGRFVIEQESGQKVSDGRDVRTWACRTLVSRCEKIQVLPPTLDSDPAPPTVNPVSFSNQTAGAIVRQCISWAHERGVADWLAITAQEDTDSAGGDWADTDLEVSFEVGSSLMDVLNWLRDNGFCEYRMFGRQLRLYNVDYGVDHTLEPDAPVLQAGLNMIDAPISESSQDVATRVLVTGDEGSWAWVIDENAEADWGDAYEASYQVSGTQKKSSLTTIGLYFLKRYNRVRSSRSVEIDVSSLNPFADFATGDYIWVDYGSEDDEEVGVVRERIVKSALSIADERPVAAIVLNDWFLELDLKLARKLQRMGGNS